MTARYRVLAHAERTLASIVACATDPTVPEPYRVLVLEAMGIVCKSIVTFKNQASRHRKYGVGVGVGKPFTLTEEQLADWRSSCT